MGAALPHIASFLGSLRSRQRMVWLIALSGGLLGVLLALLLLSGSLEAFLWMNPGDRIYLTIIFSIIGILSGLAFLGASVFVLMSRSLLSDQALAKVVWRLDPKVRDRVLDALELASAESMRGSEALRLMAVQSIDESVKELNLQAYLRTSHLRIVAWFSGIILLFSLPTFLIAGKSLTDALDRIAHPRTIYLKPGTVLLAMDMPAEQDVVEGDTLQIAARAQHFIPERISFFCDFGGGLIREAVAHPDAEAPELFTATLTDFERNVHIWAQVEGSSSDTVLVKVLPRPRLARLEVTLQPPRYTGLNPMELPEGIGDITALPGTNAHIQIEANRNLSGATLLVDVGDGELRSFDMGVSDRAASGSFQISRKGAWWIELTADDGVQGKDPLQWAIALQEDLPPSIDIRLPDDGYEIPETMQAPLGLIIDDDYGISRANLRYRVYNSIMSPDSVGEDQYSSIGLNGHEETRGRWIIQTIWGFADMPLLPSEEIRFFIEAWDNDGWRGPKRSRSEERRMVYLSLDDLYRESNQEEEAVTEEMMRMLENAERMRDDMAQTLEEMRSNPEDMTWEQSQAMEQAVQSQEEMMQQLEQVRETIENMQQRFEENKMVNTELLEKYQRLQELLEEMATPEMQQAMEELQNAIEDMDGERIREALEQLTQNQEAMIESLDRSLSILEQLKLERRMEELVQRASDLAQREAELEERLSEGNADTEREAMRQQQVEQDYENLLSEMENVADELEDQYSDVADSLREMAEQMRNEEFDQSLNETTQQLQQNQQKRAQQSSKQNKERLQQMQQQMMSMQQQMIEQNKQAIEEQMDRIIQELLLISRRQEDLRTESALLGVASPRYRELAARQESMISALNRASESAGDLMKETFFVGAKLMGELEVAHTQMDAALSRYTDRRARDATGAQSNAMAAIHRSLLTLNQAKNEMQSSGSGTGYQEMMEKLQQMAQQQQAINQSTQGMPMPMPGQQAGQQMLSQMAAKQQALSEAMRQLEQQAQGMDEMLGSLDGMGQAMEEVANDLRDNNVTERTRRIQQRILQRLLDSQRSLQEREYSRERLSRTGEDVRRFSPAELQRQQENLLRERMLRALDADYAESWRPLIRDYFRALEQNQAKEDTTTPKATSQP